MKFRKLLAFLLAMVLTVSCMSVPAYAEETQEESTEKTKRLEDYDHEKVDFLSLEYEHYDSTEFEAKLDEIEQLCKDAANKDKVEELLDWFDDQLIEIYDSYSIATFHYETDPADPYWTEEDLYSKTLYSTMCALLLEKIQIICESPCKDIYTEEQIKDFLDEKVPTPEEIALQEKHNQLVNEYYNFVEPGYEYNGVYYTYASMLDDYYNGLLTFEEAVALENILLDLRFSGYGDIYFRIINNENEYAKLKGYDNYLDYCYKEEYKRNYTPADALKICQTICDNYQIFYMERYSNAWLSSEMDKALNGNYLKNLGTVVEKIAPELKESYDYMMETNSCVITPKGGVTNSYTYYVRGLGMPFICMELYDDVFDVQNTLFHEFGHYNANYWTDLRGKLIPIETHEIFSQGLELLATKYYDLIFGEISENVEKVELDNTLHGIYDVARVTEIECTAYLNTYETADELVEALNAVNYKYYPDYIPSWMYVSHIFSTPGYYISYMMTAISALEIYEKSKENYDEAVDLYIKLISNATEEPIEALKETGNLTYKWTAKKINKLLEKIMPTYYDVEAPVINGVEDGKVYDEAVSINITDESGLQMLVYIDGEAVEMLYRSFDIGGSNSPIEILVTDAFDNYTYVQFEVEPAPFTVDVDINTAGEQSLSWKKQAYASRYRVYGAPLGEKYKKLGTVDGNTTTFVNKKADDRVWKYYVVADYIDVDGSAYVLGKSYKSFVAGLGNEKYTDVKIVEIEGGEELTLKAGESKKLTIDQTKLEEEKKLIKTKKIKAVRYYSSDENVAKVSDKGKITAVSEGSCYIYVIAENGKTDKVKVEVG